MEEERWGGGKGGGGASVSDLMVLMVASGLHQRRLGSVTTQQLTGRIKALLAQVKCAQIWCWRFVSQTSKHSEDSSCEQGMQVLLLFQFL